jgi:hypothetical protein
MDSSTNRVQNGLATTQYVELGGDDLPHQRPSMIQVTRVAVERDVSHAVARIAHGTHG